VYGHIIYRFPTNVPWRKSGIYMGTLQNASATPLPIYFFLCPFFLRSLEQAKSEGK
jgi:hypothetical protein